MSDICEECGDPACLVCNPRPQMQWLIESRISGEEAFIPLSMTPKAVSILKETARRMGYDDAEE